MALRTDARVHVLGIRHHGPGSARSVAAALAELQPDQVIIEGPPELDRLIEWAADNDLVPPVAALTYATDEPRRAAFYPMASFSPEWVALRWAITNAVDVRFADLPAANLLAPPPRPEPAETHPEPVEGPRSVAGPELKDPRSEPGEEPPATADPEQQAGQIVRRDDPIARLARTAGYDDPERWWEDAVEHRESSTLERFDAIREALAHVRADDRIDLETRRREASMRKIIRSVIRAGKQRIAIVCGAYHAPVLHPDTFGPASADNKLLSRLPRTKITVTWAPWTSARLALASGYGAGVTSPGWYHHLFTSWQQDRAADVVPGWLTRTARALRDEGISAAPATTVDAVRLADALAAIRGRPSVGLTELIDATQTVLCEGSAAPLSLVERELVVGNDLGQVPESVPSVPLAADLARLQRRLRLKPDPDPTTIMLDLRRENGRERSLLLHRLNLLDIPWGVETDTGGTTGTFKEAWELCWQPEFAVALVEAGLYGTTVVDAAANRVIQQARNADDLAALSRLTTDALVAELPEALSEVIDILAAQTAHQHDTLTLLQTVEPLARTQRYGDVRNVETGSVAEVLDAVITRASVGLRAACSALADDAAETMREAVDAAHRGVALTGIGVEEWRQALATVAADDQLNGLICGRANRLQLDASAIDRDEVARRLSRRLSPGTDPADGAAWLDGFLDGDAVLLLHDPVLLQLVDDWVGSTDDDAFSDLLPLLRRTFSRFEPAERRQLGERLRRGKPKGPAAERDFDLDRARPVMARVADLLGLR